MTIITLGPEGTYSHRAARSVDEDVAFLESVSQIVEGIATGEYDRAVIPIENSIEGGVTESLDMLADNEVSVLGEIIVPIEHAIIGQTEEFTTVSSHPQAIAQCREHLRNAYPEINVRKVSSTARGVELARTDSSIAAIADPGTSDRWDTVTVLETGIQDNPSNATRFFVLGPLTDRQVVGEKSTVIIYPGRNHPGLLVKLLQPFADREINLTRIDARPSEKRLGDYIIHLDLAGPYRKQKIKDAIDEVERIFAEGWVRWVGSYDVTQLNE